MERLSKAGNWRAGGGAPERRPTWQFARIRGADGKGEGRRRKGDDRDGPTRWLDSTRRDIVAYLPAQTMAPDTGGGESLLPMGTAFEWLELTFFDLVALRPWERTGQSFDDVRARHTNVE